MIHSPRLSPPGREIDVLIITPLETNQVIRLFAEYLRSLGFVEIMTPKLLGGASEGGAEVFKTDYFG